MKTGFKTKTSWREKLETHREPQIHRVLIPGSYDVEKLIKKVPSRKLITNKQLKDILTEKYKVNATCVKVLGIHIRIVAEAAEEELNEGGKVVTPYWRVIKKDGALYPKFPGAPKKQAAKLKEEGHTTIPGKGKKQPAVKNFENYLIKI